MTVNVSDFRATLVAARNKADDAATLARANGNKEGAQFAAGQAAGLTTAITLLTAAENAKARELEDETARNIEDERLGEQAVRLGVVGNHGYGQGVDLAAAQRLEDFARSAGGEDRIHLCSPDGWDDDAAAADAREGLYTAWEMLG